MISPGSMLSFSRSRGSSLASAKMSSEAELFCSWSETSVSLLSHSNDEISDDEPNSRSKLTLVALSIDVNDGLSWTVGVLSSEEEESKIDEAELVMSLAGKRMGVLSLSMSSSASDLDTRGSCDIVEVS